MLRTLDWKKAAKLVAKSGPQTVMAGILEDWYSTSEEIVSGGYLNFESRPCVTSRFGGTPAVSIDGGEPIPCFVLKTPSDRLPWPTDARKIIAGHCQEIYTLADPETGRAFDVRYQVGG